MKFDRAYRRQQIARLKQNRKNYWGYPQCYSDHFEQMEDKQLGTVVQNPQVCSGYCCGNPRKHYRKRTLKEQSFYCEKIEE